MCNYCEENSPECCIFIDPLSNDYYLPLAFRVSDDMTNLELDSKKPLENQHKIVSSAMGEDIEICKILPPLNKSYNVIYRLFI